MSCRNIRFISWNVKGMNSAIKANKVVNHLQHLKGDLCFLQETHLRTSDISRIKKPWMGHVFHSKFSERARGAAIIIHRDIAFEPATSIVDPNGRYVIVSGNLQGAPVVLASLYAPTWDDDKFMSKFFSSIPNVNDHFIIVGGDFNQVQNTELDRSSSNRSTAAKSAKVLKFHADQLGLTDPWRAKFPSSRVFSFFSHVHHSYSRIDFFLLDNKLLHNILSCDYHSIVISDHAPTSIDVNFPRGRPPTKTWRFNSHLLSEPKFKDFLTTHIQIFFDINDKPDIGCGVLWESFKAYLRGQVISFVSHFKKSEHYRLNGILDEIKKLDNVYALSPSPALYKKRLQLQSQHDLCSTGKVEKLLLQTKQRFFEHGDKAGKLLAYQARAAAASRLIPRIQAQTGDVTTDPLGISNIFSDFYSKLYSSELSPHDWDNPNPLDFLVFPQAEDSTGLGAPITISEVKEAIDSLQSNKSPGPDGYSTEFYKTFSMTLAPVLVRLFNDAFLKGQLPPTLSEASITLLLKKDKDPLLCGSYRPISLLNVDYKILAKVLACRLQKAIPTLINPDQTGFISGRQSFFNTRRLFNILFSSSSNTPEIVLSLDAEKAFDRVEWRFLFYTLGKFGLGSNFISWVKLLYSSPRASVHVNGINSDQFALFRGTRQGCPMSPLLFALVVEPLAMWLRSEGRFEGIMRFGSSHKLSLYADDLLLYVSNPASSIPVILNILEQFQKLSGYKLNLQKSEYLPVNPLAESLPHALFPFSRVTEGFRYLGIFFTKSFTELFVKNFHPLLDRLKADLARWSSLPLSVSGRVNLIKMVVAPRFLYAFLHIPIFLSKSFFSTLDRLINSFLWGGKKARIRRTVLQLPKSAGGLALPNLRHYYWACNINKLLYWRTTVAHVDLPHWAHIEMSSSRISLWSVVCSQLPLSIKQVSQNPIVSSTLRIWNQFRKQFGLHLPSGRAPILRNHLFLPSCSDPVFRDWAEKGLLTINNLYDGGVFSSFADLSLRFGLPHSHLFRFFQIRHFVQNQFPQFPGRPPDSLTDTFLALDTGLKGLTSIIYDRIFRIIPTPLDSLRAIWDHDLGITLSDEQWERMLDLVHTSSISARHSLLQCKILHRVHYTNARLARIYPDRSDACCRCKQSPADHMHMFWSCPRLSGFWAAIFDTLNRVLGAALDPIPLTALFGVPLTQLTIPKTSKQVIAFSTLLARRLILLKWTHPAPPTHNRWIHEILHCIRLERIRFSLKGSLKAFHRTWQPFLEYIDTLTVNELTD